jgi:hypothetical protein
MSNQQQQQQSNDINSLRRASVVDLAPFLPANSTPQNIPSLEYVYLQQQQYKQRQRVLQQQSPHTVPSGGSSANTPQSTQTPLTPSTIVSNSLSDLYIGDTIQHQFAVIPNTNENSTASLAMQQQQVQIQMQQQLRQQIFHKQQQQELQLKQMSLQIEQQLKKLMQLETQLSKQFVPVPEQEPTRAVLHPVELSLDTKELSEEWNNTHAVVDNQQFFDPQKQYYYDPQYYPQNPISVQSQQQSSLVHSFVNETQIEVKSFELLTEELEKQKKHSPTENVESKTLVSRGPIKRKNNRPKEYDKMMTKFILK